MVKMKENDSVVEKRNVRLVHGDSRKLLRGFPDCYFDAIITDPPYGIGFEDYDSSAEVFFELEEEFFRVLKKGGWFVFWWSTKKIPDIAKIKKFAYRWMLIAEIKGATGKSIAGDRTYASIFVFSKGDAKVKARFADMLPAVELPQMNGRKIKQGDFKPTYVQGCLLSMFAGKNGKVLDPFAGFGSLLLSALLTGTGKEVWGVEIDEARFEVAKKILEHERIPGAIPDMLNGLMEKATIGLFGGSE